MSESAPLYVTCPCQHCSGKIEFDANQLDPAENATALCPHCELETIIFVPEQKVPPIISDGNLRKAMGVKNQEEIRKIRISAEQDDQEAQFNLGMIYYRGVEVTRDFAEAIKWWRKSAEQGNADAQYALGCICQDGTGVPKDLVQAVRWYRLSAAQTNPYAQFNLGLAYWEGEGVLRDFTEATKWFRLAAEQGLSEAQTTLGKAFAQGKGVVKDLVESIRWIRAAAEQGDSNAQTGLAIAYQDSNVSPPDFVEAYKWASLAASAGVGRAMRLRDTLATQMTPFQLEEGQRLASTEAERIEKLPKSVTRASELCRQRKEIQATIAQISSRGGRTGRSERMTIPSHVRREVWRRDGGACVKCGSRKNLEFDHIVPVSKGGSNTARNIELLCESCNRSKSDSIR